MELYDKNFIGKLGSFDKYANPWVLAICKNNRPVAIYEKNQIEKWFKNLPSRVMPDLYNRLRSKDDGNFLSAYYELVFHQYCLEEGWDVTKDKEINNTTPDLFVKTPENQFVVEVLVLQKSDVEKRNDSNFRQLLRNVEAIETKYLLSIDLDEWLSEDMELDKIIDLIATKVRDEGNLTENKEISISDFGFKGRIGIHPRKDYEPIGKVLSWSPPGGSFEFPTTRIRSEMRKKIRKYCFLKEMKIPLVLAVCSDEAPFISHNAMDWTLYGRMVVSWNLNDPDTKTTASRDNSGFITPNPGLLWETRNKGLSAVIFCSRHWEQERVLYDMRVYHNPWAVNPLPTNVFEKMPQFAEVSKDPNFISLEWLNNKEQKIIFN